jgi:hypothetical protein
MICRDLLHDAAVALRDEAGVKFRQFNDQHADARGLRGADKDPEGYIAEHR